MILQECICYGLSENTEFKSRIALFSLYCIYRSLHKTSSKCRIENQSSILGRAGFESISVHAAGIIRPSVTRYVVQGWGWCPSGQVLHTNTCTQEWTRV